MRRHFLPAALLVIASTGSCTSILGSFDFPPSTLNSADGSYARVQHH